MSRCSRALALVAATALLCAAALSVDAVEVVCIPQKACVHAFVYEGSVMEVKLLPATEGKPYEVKDVVVGQTVEAVGPSCVSLPDSNLRCTVESVECRIEVETVIAADAVTVSYACSGDVLVTSRIPLETVAAPSVDFTFPRAARLYGLPEHTTDLALEKDRRYHMFNTDAYQYALNSTEPLYGSIPFLMAHGTSHTVGVLFLNSAEMFVTITEDSASGVKGCKWTAEVGVLDLFFFPGPTPAKVQQQHASITGTGSFPPLFSLGYHQCRWNYRSTNDCLSVDQGFDRHSIPYDALWLDIEHTDSKKYFTWDKHNFPEPEKIVAALASKGRKLVTVKDPHVKRENGYFVHDEAVKNNYYISAANGEVYEGDCWPGRSSWPDFYNKRTREWYATLFLPERYAHSSGEIHTWVDMNEPSVMKGPMNTMHRDAVHVADDGTKVEHRYLHNMYSLYSLMAAYDGHLLASRKRDSVLKRPFILTRSFFPGSQRYAAMWTGDNMARWSHLENSIPQLLSLSISNYPFCGADVGGFFFEPEEELMVRWVQTAVFYPFFRGHAHLETKRREPWTFSETATNQIRNAIALRYSLLPYLYTQMYHVNRYGSTLLRPLFFEFPSLESVLDEQGTFMFGPALLAHPVTAKGLSSVSVTLPAGAVWYNYHTAEMHRGDTVVDYSVTLDTFPLFLRGGYIVPVKLRLRRSSAAMDRDPYTLYVALNAKGNSHGDLFVDDGESFEYQSGSFLHREFSFSDGVLENNAAADSSANPYASANFIERIIIFGFVGMPKSAHARIGHDNELQSAGGSVEGHAIEFERLGGALILRKPNVRINEKWTIHFESP